MGNHGASSFKTDKSMKSDRKHSKNSSREGSPSKSTSQTPPQQTSEASYIIDPTSANFYNQVHCGEDQYGQGQYGGPDAYENTDDQYGWKQPTERIAKWSCVSSLPFPEDLPTRARGPTMS